MLSIVLKKISEFNLAPVKPCILELTDGGPGVGVSNFDVRFRDAEIALLHNSGRRARLHLATINDSARNEAERSNACIGDALVDGGSLKWEYYAQYHGLEEEELKRMSAKELEDLENDQMKNSWRVAEEVRLRIDSEPVPNGFLGAIVSEKPGEEFFYNKEYLSQYNNTSKSKRHVISGHAHFNRVESSFESHYEMGELYFEFLKGDFSRKGELCETCKENGWIGPDSLKGTPRPYLDVKQLPCYHCFSVGNIPVHNRAPDA